MEYVFFKYSITGNMSDFMLTDINLKYLYYDYY